MSAWSKSTERNAEGHLTELLLSALADGQHDALSSEAATHLEACDVCQGRFADAIVEHEAIDRAMEALPSDAAVKVPWAWIAASFAALVVIRAPAAVSSFTDGSWMRDVERTGHVVSLVGWSLCDERSMVASVVSVGLSVLVVAALAAWMAPRPEKI